MSNVPMEMPYATLFVGNSNVCPICPFARYTQSFVGTAMFALSALWQDIRSRLLVTAMFALSALLQDIRSRNVHDIALTFRKGQGQM